MPKIKGNITAKEISEGVQADGTPWKRASFTIGNKKYSTFDLDIINSFNPGNYVEVEYELSKDGRFSNIKEMKTTEEIEEVTVPAAPTTQSTDQTSPNQSVWDKKDLRNARMNGLNNAVGLLTLLGNIDPEGTKAKLDEVDSPLTLVKDIAKQLIDFIYE